MERNFGRYFNPAALLRYALAMASQKETARLSERLLWAAGIRRFQYDTSVSTVLRLKAIRFAALIGHESATRAVRPIFIDICPQEILQFSLFAIKMLKLWNLFGLLP